jgi:hypothetical protein
MTLCCYWTLGIDRCPSSPGHPPYFFRYFFVLLSIAAGAYHRHFCGLARLDVIGIKFWGLSRLRAMGWRRIFIAVLATLAAFRLMYVTPSGGDRVPHFLLD